MESPGRKNHTQWLSRAENPVRYMRVIDNPVSEGYQIREHVIFPTLFSLMRHTLGVTHTPMLDFGSGTGSLTARIAAQFGLFVEGLDVSPNFVKLASAQHPEIPFYVARTQYTGGYSLHNTHSHLVLHCTAQPAKLIETMVDATGPNGYLFITVPHPEHFKAAYARAQPEKTSHTVKVGEQVTMTYYYRTLAEYEAMFRYAGLTLLKKQECFAGQDAPRTLQKYKDSPYFVVYALQKKIDTIDTALITHSGSGRLLLLTRALDDDKFPGVKSLFSIRRSKKEGEGVKNLAQGMRSRLNIEPQYISPHPIGSLLVKHHHETRAQHADVNLYAVKISHLPPSIQNKFYIASQFIPPKALRPFGGACTLLGYEFLRSHK